MKKSISFRREKKNSQINDVSVNKEPSKIHNDILEGFYDNVFSDEILLVKEDLIRIDSKMDNLIKLLDNTDPFQKINKNLDDIIKFQQDLMHFSKNGVNNTFHSLIDAIKSQESSNIALINKVTDEIIKEQTHNIKIVKDELNKLLNIFVNGKKDKDLERTISFQLGKEIIDSSKNIQSIVNLPKKLYQLRQETINRKQASIQKKIIEVKPEVLSKSNLIESKNIDNKFLKTLTLIDIFNRYPQKLKFNGSLIEQLGLKTHDIIDIKKDNRSLVMLGYKSLPTARYFKSENFINIKDLDGYVENNRITFGSKVQEKGIEFEFLLSFFDKDQNRLSFNIVKPNITVSIQLPLECTYIQNGIKLINATGVAIIEDVYYENSVNQKIEEVSSKHHLKDGVSIVIPSYKGEKTIEDTLISIVSQKNIDLNLLEIICVINGEIDDTPNIIENFKNKYDIDIKLLFSEKKGASAARNLGIKTASREYLLFVDDDDMVSKNYINDLYKLANKESLILCYINDLDQFGNLNKDTAINKQLVDALDSPSIVNTSSAITMVASKLLVTDLVKSLEFNENLRSGEDVSFFTEYVQKFNPKIQIVNSRDCAYIRRVVENSVSRQPLSFDFNVEQRLDVIKELERIDISENKISNFTLSKIKAQIGFIIQYLKEYPNDTNLVIDEIIVRKIFNFPYEFFWERLGKLEAEQLVFSYCHPPFVDTSATIVGKRIHQFGLLSDVIANDMSKNRNIDPEMMLLDKHYLKSLSFLDIPASFGGWGAIKQFVEQSNILAIGKNYKQVYSRVLWPASNFAAAEYKLKNHETKWIAEFSDPVVLDIEGNDRLSDLDDSIWLNQFLEYFKGKYDFLKVEKNLYVWCELLTYLFADEIIFTCENQRQLMLEKFKYKEIALLAYTKSKILPHPQPNHSLYDINQTEYILDTGMINIGYFGVFYKNRKLHNLIDMLVQYDKNMNLPVRIHLFTSNVVDVIQELTELDVLEYFVINEYVGYFEFLNISKKMDVLIVNDAKVSDIFGFNPYLPSKMSDYLGSGKPIWAFVESNSALAKINSIQFKTNMKDSTGTNLVDIISFFNK